MNVAAKKKLSVSRKKAWLEIHEIQGELNCTTSEARAEHKRRKAQMLAFGGKVLSRKSVSVNFKRIGTYNAERITALIEASLNLIGLAGDYEKARDILDASHQLNDALLRQPEREDDE